MLNPTTPTVEAIKLSELHEFARQIWRQREEAAAKGIDTLKAMGDGGLAVVKMLERYGAGPGVVVVYDTPERLWPA
jgi:hypothetical protein